MELLTDEAISAFFRIMSAAIKELDASLREQLDGAHADRPQFRNLHHGVLSVGREPILMWEIFRALLRAGYAASHGIEFRWEHQYPPVAQRKRRTGLHMDLAFVSDSADGKQQLVSCIEAKGFDDDVDRLRANIVGDIEKMSELPSAARLFALAFSDHAANKEPTEVLQWWERERSVISRPEWHDWFDTLSLTGQRRACITLLEVRRGG